MRVVGRGRNFGGCEEDFGGCDFDCQARDAVGDHDWDFVVGVDRGDSANPAHQEDVGVRGGFGFFVDQWLEVGMGVLLRCGWKGGVS